MSKYNNEFKWVREHYDGDSEITITFPKHSVTFLNPDMHSDFRGMPMVDISIKDLSNVELKKSWGALLSTHNFFSEQIDKVLSKFDNAEGNINNAPCRIIAIKQELQIHQYNRMTHLPIFRGIISGFSANIQEKVIKELVNLGSKAEKSMNILINARINL